MYMYMYISNMLFYVHVCYSMYMYISSMLFSTFGSLSDGMTIDQTVNQEDPGLIPG